MSIETSSAQAEVCPGCGHVFAFLPYHVPHCQAPLMREGAVLSARAQGIVNTLASIGATFPGVSKEAAREVAERVVRNARVDQLVGSGPQADKPIGKRRANKGNTAAKKRPRKGGKTQ